MSITSAITQLGEKLSSVLSVSGAYVGQEVPVPGGPDIIYHPDEAKWKARTARRLKEDVWAMIFLFCDIDTDGMCSLRFSTPPFQLVSPLSSSPHLYGKERTSLRESRSGFMH